MLSMTRRIASKQSNTTQPDCSFSAASFSTSCSGMVGRQATHCCRMLQDTQATCLHFPLHFFQWHGWQIYHTLLQNVEKQMSHIFTCYSPFPAVAWLADMPNTAVECCKTKKKPHVYTSLSTSCSGMIGRHAIHYCRMLQDKKSHMFTLHFQLLAVAWLADIQYTAVECCNTKKATRLHFTFHFLQRHGWQINHTPLKNAAKQTSRTFTFDSPLPTMAWSANTMAWLANMLHTTEEYCKTDTSYAAAEKCETIKPHVYTLTLSANIKQLLYTQCLHRRLFHTINKHTHTHTHTHTESFSKTEEKITASSKQFTAKLCDKKLRSFNIQTLKNRRQK